jgi:hypothetical protein
VGDSAPYKRNSQLTGYKMYKPSQASTRRMKFPRYESQQFHVYKKRKKQKWRRMRRILSLQTVYCQLLFWSGKPNFFKSCWATWCVIVKRFWLRKVTQNRRSCFLQVLSSMGIVDRHISGRCRQTKEHNKEFWKLKCRICSSEGPVSQR